MLRRAKAKFPQVEVQKMGLQELAFQDAFDGILCVDAMEFVFPEDWPLVLANFHRALKPSGYLYFTVEVAPAEEVEVDYQAGKAMDLPVVPGESAVEGGYHYYPEMEQVRRLVNDASFTILDEAVSVEYHHFWLRRKD
jgi:SAM-dependent methyltransferase